MSHMYGLYNWNYQSIDMDHIQKSAKDQLTSELMKDMIIRASEAGVNVSSIINQLQSALTDRGNKYSTPHDLKKTYKKVFRAMKFIIKPYKVDVEIGSAVDYEVENNHVPLTLTHCGPVMPGQTGRYIHGAVVTFSYEPMKVLYNLLLEITKAAEENKHKAKTFEAVLRSVKAMSDEMHNEGLSRSEVSA
jgi:hypothetical protein